MKSPYGKSLLHDLGFTFRAKALVAVIWHLSKQGTLNRGSVG